MRERSSKKVAYSTVDAALNGAERQVPDIDISTQLARPSAVRFLASHVSWYVFVINIDHNLLKSRLEIPGTTRRVSKSGEGSNEGVYRSAAKNSRWPIVELFWTGPPPSQVVLGCPSYTIVGVVLGAGNPVVAVIKIWEFFHGKGDFITGPFCCPTRTKLHASCEDRQHILAVPDFLP